MPLTRRTFLKAGVLLATTVPLLDYNSKADPEQSTLVDLVNPLQGTNSKREFSRGNTLPIVARPFGMTHWIPQSNLDDRWFFDPNSTDFVGVRATHQPCPWAGDYANFTVMGETDQNIFDAQKPFATFAPGDLVVRPYYFSVVLRETKIKIETTATERCSIIRFTFPAGTKARIRFNFLTHIEAHVDQGAISGSSNFGARPAQPKDAAGYLYAAFSQPIESATTISQGIPLPNQTSADGHNVGMALDFVPNGPIEVRIGTSFISADQARINLTHEVGSQSFEAVCKDSKATWNASLACAVVEGGSLEDRRTFYSCLYRTKIFPRVLHEYSADGRQIHYSSADDKVHDGPSYGDTGFWDTYRTQFPLLSILEPQRMGEMIQGFLNAYKEGGWLPQWPSPGWGFSMPGTHGDSVVADALVKNIPGFDRELAGAAVRKDADVPGTIGGRGNLTEYIAKGYIPTDAGGPTAASTLDYAYDDFCASQAAGALGNIDDQRRLRDRSLNYRNLYDSTVGFINGKSADGTWNAPFDPITWGGPFIEAAAWQSTWSAPHDLGGLMELMGGRQSMVRKLDLMLLQAPRFNVGTYGQVIHEMAEMAAFEFGQYDQGNQPVHIALYVFAASGCPWKTQYYTRRVLREMYSPDMYPGDDDNGEMAAWYVLNALGFYPHCPGYPTYVLGSPLFPGVRLKMGNGKELLIKADNNSAEAVYVNGVRLNGKQHKQLWITHADIVNGGELRFKMATRPSGVTLDTDDMPFSITPIAGPINTAEFYTYVRINCGSDLDIEDFVGDAFFNGGTAVNTPATTAVPAPDDLYAAEIYQTARTGTFVYSVPLPTPPIPQTYTVKLHFLNFGDMSGGNNGQEISINGKAVIAGLGAVAAGGSDLPVVREFTEILPDKNGRITVSAEQTQVSSNTAVMLCALEIASS